MSQQKMPTYINPRAESEKFIQDRAGFVNKTSNRIFASTHLATIVECERNTEGEYTGRATVELLSTPGVRRHCLLPIPCGQSYWFGTMPPAGSMCLISWLPMGIGIITAIYPISFRRMVSDRHLQNIEPGELLLQASSGQRTDEQQQEGRALFDRNGRITLETRDGDARIVLGDPGLANGLANLETQDEITTENIALQLSVGNTVINVTQDGSVVIDADKIYLGSGSRHKKLATEDFVENVYNSHVHLNGTYSVPGAGAVVGASSVPNQTGNDTHLTEKTVAK